MVVVYHNLQHSLRLGDLLERVLHNCVFWLYVSSHPAVAVVKIRSLCFEPLPLNHIRLTILLRSQAINERGLSITQIPKFVTTFMPEDILPGPPDGSFAPERTFFHLQQLQNNPESRVQMMNLNAPVVHYALIVNHRGERERLPFPPNCPGVGSSRGERDRMYW
jgi:hypothetical protein